MAEKERHQVLARKYRPQKFKDVIEQQTAVRSLQNAVNTEKFGSAYLFCGPRGVGKTTLARILAKRVNCTSPEKGEPCNVCESCSSILNGNSLDVLEIDAASHRGIQNIRELRENVKFQPMAAKNKVYIIDEAHMLTSESFNALLKTLEEPPPHVIFILATTEFNKMPETILSRCQVFIFRKVSIKTIATYLQTLCKKEKIEAEEEALFWLARRGDGSIRDSLSFLEQAIAYCGKKITTAEIKKLIGALSLDLFIDLTRSLIEPIDNKQKIIEPIHEIFNAGGDLNRFIWEYLEFLRIIILIKKGVENTEYLGIPGRDVQQLRKTFIDSDSAVLIEIFNAIYALFHRAGSLRLRNSYETRILVEIELFSLKEKLSRPSLTSVLTKLNKLSAALGQDRSYSSENELQKHFLGTVVDADSVGKLE